MGPDMGSGEPIAWHSVFCPRPDEMAALQAGYEKAADPRSPRPRVVVLLSESGLTRCEAIEHRRRHRCCKRLGPGRHKGKYRRPWPRGRSDATEHRRRRPDACAYHLPLVPVSLFLRVFSTISPVEYVVTGLAYVAVEAGWWHYPASAAPPLCYNHGLAVVGGRSWGRRLCAESTVRVVAIVEWVDPKPSVRRPRDDGRA
jgi:hypothetical protein